VWVLTGDKQETAINIGYSSRLLNQSMDLLLLNESGLDGTREAVVRYTNQFISSDQGTPEEQHIINAAVIIDGKTLKYALGDELRKDFFSLCCKCRSVIVCRASPIQKAEVSTNSWLRSLLVVHSIVCTPLAPLTWSNPTPVSLL